MRYGENGAAPSRAAPFSSRRTAIFFSAVPCRSLSAGHLSAARGPFPGRAVFVPQDRRILFRSAPCRSRSAVHLSPARGPDRCRFLPRAPCRPPPAPLAGAQPRESFPAVLQLCNIRYGTRRLYTSVHSPVWKVGRVFRSARVTMPGRAATISGIRLMVIEDVVISPQISPRSM